ncbi:MAG: thiolase domain-containing protein [Planctomycetes bacterium]|nr:thiolase domain-containing protein [Planctomycetota bacterium]
MRDVYLIAGGMSRFAKARPEATFQKMVKEAFDAAMAEVPDLKRDEIDGSVASYFSDHFTRQLKAATMAQDYIGLCPKMSRRVEGGGATGGLCLQSAWEAVASGRMDVCLAFGFETMSRVGTWKGNEFIALASDVNFDYPVGGFYTGYYAMMVVRHMKEFGTTPEQLAAVSVKNHTNAIHNPFAQLPAALTIEDVRAAPMVAWPLTRLDVCVMSDGAACCILASEEAAKRYTDKLVKVTGLGCGTDTMRMADRPRRKVPLLPHESEADYKDLQYPGIHSFRAGRTAAIQTYKMAGITNPVEQLDFVELHDAYTSSEIQTYEDLGLCKYGEGGRLAASGRTCMPSVHYKLKFPDPSRGGEIPVNPSGGLLACGHPVGATGLMQAVFALWQLQGTMKEHLGNDRLQVPNARRGLIHSHAGTGTYITVTILERAF